MATDIEYIESGVKDEFLHFLMQCIDCEEEYLKYKVEKVSVTVISDEELQVSLQLNYDKFEKNYLHTTKPIECYGNYSSFFRVVALELLDDYIGSTENPIIEESREIIPILLHNAMCSSSHS